MPFVPVPNTAQVILEYQTNSKPITNGFYFEKGTEWDAASLEALADTVFDAWAEGLQAAINTITFLTRISCIALFSETAPASVNTISALNQGTAAGDPLPRNVAMSVTFGTGLRGRSFRGRIYHTGTVDEWLLNEGQWDPESRALIDLSYGTFLGAITTEATCTHVVVSRVQGGVTLAVGETTPVTSVQARLPIATVRKRI